MSELSRPSVGGETSFSSPLQATVTGVPSTPEGRVIVAINEDAIDQGYDSDGNHAPWQDVKKEFIDGVEMEEASLPFGPEPSLPVEPTPEIVVQKIVT